jgi:hypothetical protein
MLFALSMGADTEKLFLIMTFFSVFLCNIPIENYTGLTQVSQSVVGA